MRSYLNILIFILLMSSCSEDEEITYGVSEPEIDQNTGTSDNYVKDILKEKNYDVNKFFVGAALNTNQLNTYVENIFLNEFNYSTVENSAKQSIVHPEPGMWKWDRLDSYIDFIERNSITSRIHGPVGPQSSKWAKNDSRTEQELMDNMTEYMTELSKKLNLINSVKWMDVVNETITTTGKWFGEKVGDDKWENPWKQIGMNEDGVPIYICKAFEIADEYAKNVKLIFNQHGGMEVEMWDKVKETILYLREKGYRVDGLGWQAHLKDDKKLSLNKNSLEYLSILIDCAHQNDLEFHITEIDYVINEDPPTDKSLLRQSHGYANILKLLISKRDNGLITYSSWGVVDKTNEHKFLFTEDFKPKPAILKIRETLDAESVDLVYLD